MGKGRVPVRNGRKANTMTKTEYVTEMLQDMLSDNPVTDEQISQWAKSIIDGIDMWHEMSSDSVATTNRYQYLEGQIEQLKKSKEDALDKQEREYKEKLKDINQSARAIIYNQQREIEELKKQIL